jgi:hypothetical protein
MASTLFDRSYPTSSNMTMLRHFLCRNLTPNAAMLLQYLIDNEDQKQDEGIDEDGKEYWFVNGDDVFNEIGLRETDLSISWNILINAGLVVMKKTDFKSKYYIHTSDEELDKLFMMDSNFDLAYIDNLKNKAI